MLELHCFDLLWIRFIGFRFFVQRVPELFYSTYNNPTANELMECEKWRFSVTSPRELVLW